MHRSLFYTLLGRSIPYCSAEEQESDLTLCLSSSNPFSSFEEENERVRTIPVWLLVVNIEMEIYRR